MGFRIRKSINLGGGFRVNLSKSGVGYSWGVPGYRVTKTARGNVRKTYSVPGTGFSYVEESSNKNRGNPSNNTIQESIMKDIVSADIESYQPAEYKDFIISIEKILSLNKISNWLCFTFLFAFKKVFLFTGIIGLFLKIYIKTKGKISIDYELDEYYLDRHNKIITAWDTLNNCSALWQILQTGDVLNKKIHAGASTLVNRKNFKIIEKAPFYLKTDIRIIQVKLHKETLVFLPDKVIVIKGSKIGAISYDDIHIDTSYTNFIETSTVPKDTEIIDYTWEKVNKNGTPDKRYKNNRQLPICKYGVIKLYSNSGLNIILYCSNFKNAIEFGDSIG